MKKSFKKHCLSVAMAVLGFVPVSASLSQNSLLPENASNLFSVSTNYLGDNVIKKTPFSERISINQRNILLDSSSKESDNIKWWGYFDGNFDNTFLIGLGEYADVPVTYTCCIKVPASHIMGKGKTIKGLKMIVPSKKHLQDFKIWMSEELPDDVNKADVCVIDFDNSQIVDVNNEGERINELMFPESYTITDKDIYVGYSFTITELTNDNDMYPIVMGDSEVTANNAAFVNMGGYWEDLSGQNYGNLAIQLLMEGDYKDSALAFDSGFPDLLGFVGDKRIVSAKVSNYGTEPVKKFAYTVTIGDFVSEKKTVVVDDYVSSDLALGRFGGEYTFDFDVEFGKEAVSEECVISIIEVNGKENYYADRTCTGLIIPIEKAPKRRIALEECACSWFGLCPFGFVGMEKAQQVFGDGVVIVTIHDDDEMDCWDYKEFRNTEIKSYPSVHIDRKVFSLHPYYGTADPELEYFGLEDDIRKYENDIAPAELSISGVVDTELNVVRATSNSKFMFSGDKANYALAFILTSNALTGDENWDQSNMLDGTEDLRYEPLFDRWIDGESSMGGILYDHIAVGAKGIVNGIDGSVSLPIKKDVAQEYTVEFDLADYPVIQDIEDLCVNVFMINQTTGEIMNSAMAPVSVITGIHSVGEEKTPEESSRYGVDGCKIDKFVKGINIVRYSDGTVKKIVER